MKSETSRFTKSGAVSAIEKINIDLAYVVPSELSDAMRQKGVSIL